MYFLGIISDVLFCKTLRVTVYLMKKEDTVSVNFPYNYQINIFINYCLKIARLNSI